MRLLFQLATVKPEVPYLAWAREWLASPDFVRDVAPQSVAEMAFQVLKDVDLAAHPPLAAMMREVFTRMRAVHRDSAPLMVASARLARTTGSFQESLDIALAYEREHADPMSAIMAAAAYRCLGDVRAALAAYRRAQERDPENLALWLDIGDVLWEDDQPKEALEAYSKMLEHEPEHPWALPSVLMLRAQLAGDRALLRDLTRYAETHPDNPRAQQLQKQLRAFESPPPPQ